MAVSLVRVPVSPTLDVMSLHREHGRDPLFVLREFDVKVLRQVVHNRNTKKKNSDSDEDELDSKTASPQQRKKNLDGDIQFAVTGSSEQALRVSIRAAVLRLGLAMEAATAHEIKLLKDADVLGKRAPSASLLTGTDMCRLLRAFGANSVASKLAKQLDTLQPGTLIPSSGDADMDTPRRKPSTTTRVKQETGDAHETKKRKSRDRRPRESPSASPAYQRPRSLSHGTRRSIEDVSDDDASSLSSDEHVAAGGHVASRSFQRGTSKPFESTPSNTSYQLQQQLRHQQQQQQRSHPSSYAQQHGPGFGPGGSGSTYHSPALPQFDPSVQSRRASYPSAHPRTSAYAQSEPLEQHFGVDGRERCEGTAAATATGSVATAFLGTSHSNTHPYDHIDHNNHHHHTESATHAHGSSSSQQQHTQNTIAHAHGTYAGSIDSSAGSTQQQQQHQQQQSQQSFHSQSARGHEAAYESHGHHLHANTASQSSDSFVAPQLRQNTPSIRPSPILAPSACPPSSYTSSSHHRSHKRGSAAISPNIQTSHKQIILGFPNHSNPRLTPITIPTQHGMNSHYIAHNLNAFGSVVSSPAVSGNNTPTLTTTTPSTALANSTPTTPNLNSLVRPSVSTQHLSSLRAFSANPFAKRRSTLQGQVVMDEHIMEYDSEFTFPPLVSTTEQQLRIDTSSLLPKTLIIDDIQSSNTSSTGFDSSDSSARDDIMESMDSLDDVNLDEAFGNTQQQPQVGEGVMIECKEMIIPATTATTWNDAKQTVTAAPISIKRESSGSRTFQAAKLYVQQNRTHHIHHHEPYHGHGHPVPAMAS